MYNLPNETRLRGSSINYYETLKYFECENCNRSIKVPQRHMDGFEHIVTITCECNKSAVHIESEMMNKQ